MKIYTNMLMEFWYLILFYKDQFCLNVESIIFAVSRNLIKIVMIIGHAIIVNSNPHSKTINVYFSVIIIDGIVVSHVFTISWQKKIVSSCVRNISPKLKYLSRRYYHLIVKYSINKTSWRNNKKKNRKNKSSNSQINQLNLPNYQNKNLKNMLTLF